MFPTLQPHRVANLLLVILVATSIASAAPSSSPSTKSSMLPEAPGASEQADALKLIRSLYPDEFAAHSANDRRAFARKLLKQGLETQDQPAARYVLLRQAADIASSAGDAPTAMHAIDALAGSFSIDAIGAKADALQTSSRSATSSQAFESITRCGFSTIDQAISADQYEAAQRVQAIAENAATRSKNLELINLSRDRQKELTVLHSQFDRSKSALAAVHAGSDDGATNLAAGRFLCFVKCDWEAGLPLLSRGADENLQNLAEQDLANPPDAKSQAHVGDGWWEQAEKEPSILRPHVQSRAEKWYRKSLPNLTGLTKDAVQHRINELDANRMRELHLLPGLVADVFEGQDLKRKRAQRLDSSIDFSWGKAGLGDGLPKSNYSIRWSGDLKTPTDGIYSFVLIATTGARLFIDDKPLIDNPTLSRKRNGERQTVRLPAGVHSIKVEYWTGTGEAKIHLLWIPPGATQEQVIPSDAFYHDASEN